MLPHSPECERAVLAACLLSPDAVPLAVESLHPNAFHEPKHRLIFRAIAELTEDRLPVDSLSVKSRLEEGGRLEQAGGMAYLAVLDVDLPDPSGLPAYIETVKDRFARRRLLDLSGKIHRETPTSEESATELLSRFRVEYEAIEADSGVGAGFLPIDDSIEEARGALTLPHGERVGLSTGLPDLDDIAGGFVPGQFILIAGRTGMGKSALAQHFAEHLAFDSGIPVAWLSMEMGRQEIVIRIVAHRSGIPHDSLRGNWASQAAKDRAIEELDRLRGAPLYIDDSGHVTPIELAMRLRRLRHQHSIELVIVDYLQLMGWHQRVESRAREIGMISRYLKLLAKDLHLPIVALAQLSRQADGASRPLLSHLRESGAQEQDADKVIFVHRSDATLGAEGTVAAELIVAKNRQGPTGKVDVVFRPEVFSFLCAARY